MTPPITYEQTLTTVESQDWTHKSDLSNCNICAFCKVYYEFGEGNNICYVRITLAILRAALAEASEEVCTCGHHKSTHGAFFYGVHGINGCTYCGCRNFFSRHAAIAEEIRKAEKC